MSKVKVCPFCHKEVELVISAKRYIPIVLTLSVGSFIIVAICGGEKNALGNAIALRLVSHCCQACTFESVPRFFLIFSSSLRSNPPVPWQPSVVGNRQNRDSTSMNLKPYRIWEPLEQ